MDSPYMSEICVSGTAEEGRRAGPRGRGVSFFLSHTHLLGLF